MIFQIGYLYYTLENEQIASSYSATFYVIADDFYMAVEEAELYLETLHTEEQEFTHLTEVKARYDVNIVNADFRVQSSNKVDHPRWEGDEECPSCMILHSVLDNIEVFDCPNNDYKYKVTSKGWTKLWCPVCGLEISREEIVRNKETGKLEYKGKEAK